MEGVDLAVERGELLGLIGPNGGGKSTLLLLFAGLLQPTGGTVEVLGRPAHSMAVAAEGAVGLITARPGLYPSLTARENLTFFAGLYGRSGLEGRVEELAERFGLTEVLDTYAGRLSSGQQQKVSLVRALLLEPAIVLFDEPTANLDPISADTLHRELRALADAGHAVVLCTHDLHAAAPLCDRVAVLNRTLRGVHRCEGVRAPQPRNPLHGWFEEAL